MKKLLLSRYSIYVLIGCQIMFFVTAIAAAPSEDGAEEIFKSADLKGGLVVHLGCGEGELTAALGASERFLVQGLDRDEKKVEKARAFLRTEGLSGRVSVKHWSGERLPFVSGLVNLLVVEEAGGLPESEMMRVLAPEGKLLKKEPSGWAKTIKPRPEGIDDWTHFLHGPGNNAVAQDSVVGPPRTLRWDCGPKYSRSHEMDVSIAAAVIEGGRLFSIIDKGPAGILGKGVPDKWVLEARDAFSGVFLWERPMTEWDWRLWKPELTQLDDWTGLIAQRRLIPAALPRRLVAVGGVVYLTFGVNAAVTALDAATGETIREYKGTEGTDEILLEDGVLVLTVRPKLRETAIKDPSLTVKRLSSRSPMAVREDGGVMAVDARSGNILWRAPAKSVVPFTLSTVDGRVFYHTGSELVCLDRKSGDQIWRRENTNVDANRWDVRHALVAYKDVVFLSLPKTKCQAFDACTGEPLWTGKGGRGSAFNTTPLELFVIDDLLWFTSEKQYQGQDIYTGEIKRTIELPEFFHTPGHHLRCYRARATSRFILDNKRGIEFMDLQEKNHQKNDWVRGACRYGIIPANGLIYSTPTPCSCYQTVLLKGFNALSDEFPPEAEKEVLLKGPAYGKIAAKTHAQGDWPTLRGNQAREGVSAGELGSKLSFAWKKKLGGRLTQPIFVNGRLYVASRKENILYALDAASGEIVWSRVLPAEVDSPPTYRKGRLIFGCRDGWVYNLRADDGELAWRFRAAPVDRQIVSYDRLESSWPVIGNVLVLQEGDRDVVYAAAGRNSYLDGGIYLFGLDVDTGKVLYSQQIKNPPQDNTKKYAPHEMEGAQPDILVYDGKYISMQSKVFDRQLNPVKLPAARHLYATGGFLDDLAWHRNFWLFAAGWTQMNKFVNMFPNVGQLLVHEGPRTYGVKYFTKTQGQSRVFYPQEKGYYLFCDRDNESYEQLLDLSAEERKTKTKGASSRQSVKDWEEAEATIWNAWVPVRVRAMVKSGGTLLIFGPPDEIPADDPMAPFDGRMRGELWAMDAESGEKLAAYKLDASPVFDGLIAAHGKVFASLENGTVECWTGVE